jgi:hypothetical protein
MKRGYAAQFGERFTRRLFGWLKFLSPQQGAGYFGIFATTLRVEPTHFRFEKDFNFYLNSSRAASSGEFKFKHIYSCSRGVLPRSLRCLRVWSFQRLSSGGIPAPSAFSREFLAGAAVSPTAKPMK